MCGELRRPRAGAAAERKIRLITTSGTTRVALDGFLHVWSCAEERENPPPRRSNCAGRSRCSPTRSGSSNLSVPPSPSARMRLARSCTPACRAFSRLSRQRLHCAAALRLGAEPWCARQPRRLRSGGGWRSACRSCGRRRGSSSPPSRPSRSVQAPVASPWSVSRPLSRPLEVCPGRCRVPGHDVPGVRSTRAAACRWAALPARDSPPRPQEALGVAAGPAAQAGAQ